MNKENELARLPEMRIASSQRAALPGLQGDLREAALV